MTFSHPRRSAAQHNQQKMQQTNKQGNVCFGRKMFLKKVQKLLRNAYPFVMTFSNLRIPFQTVLHLPQSEL